jgi:two-component system, LuxR family, sensor kinase FixL
MVATGVEPIPLTVLRNRIARMSPRARRVLGATVRSAGYVLLYLFLDRISFIRALHGIDVTPWNPPPGLTLVLLLVDGLAYTPAVVAAALLSSQILPLVRVPPLTGLASSLVIGLGYAGAAAALRLVFRIDIRLRRASDLVLLMVVATIAAGVVSFGFVSTYVLAGIIHWGDAGESGFQLWIGDAIGVVVLTPLLLVARDYMQNRRPIAPQRILPGAVETVAQLASIAASLVLVFGFQQDRYSFQLFYLLFLPVVWIAARRGLGGAAWAVLAVQIGLIAALEFQDKSADTIRSFQLLMFAVAVTGLLLGAVVSERHRVARALAESQGRLAAILSTARDGVLTIDKQGRVESVNPAVERLFALPAGILVGCYVGDLVPGAHALERLTSTARVPPAESPRQEFDIRRADGNLLPVEVTVGEFGDPGDPHYTLVLRDIASRRRAEASARAHESELAHVSRLSLAGEMASALAHELNQPLTAIAAYGRGCLRLLRQPAPDPRLLREGLEQVVGQAERAGDIISRLREFVTTGATQRSVVAVATLVESAVALAGIEAAQNGIEILVQIEPDLRPVLADRIQIEQVLLNLLRNGMEAILGSGATERVLSIAARRASPLAIEIAVADSGPGVPAEFATQLFEPFVTTKPLGMGLGLPISRSIVEAHEGRLRLVRKEGAGALFVFDLPVQEQEQLSRREAAHGG